MSSPLFPPDDTGIRLVSGLDELVNTPMADGINALCWQRTLPGNFAEIVHKLAVGPGITTISKKHLLDLTLSVEGNIARDILIQDQDALESYDLLPSLDVINGYVNDPDTGLFPTDVQSFHVDSAPVPADTYLCTYFGASSEGLRNEHAQRRIDIPATRAELLRLYGGTDDEGFAEYLSDHFYDLHYLPLPEAQIYPFGQHNLWRIVCQYPDSPVPPCIHRAPPTVPGHPPRLLLIS